MVSTRRMSFADFNFAVAIGTDRKRDLIPIQWFAVIACAYLLVVQDGRIAQDPVGLLMLLAPLGSMLIFLRLPEAVFMHRFFPHTMAIVDTMLISTAVALNRQSPWDLFLVFFFGTLIAAIGANFLQIINRMLDRRCPFGGYCPGFDRCQFFSGRKYVAQNSLTFRLVSPVRLFGRSGETREKKNRGPGGCQQAAAFNERSVLLQCFARTANASHGGLSVCHDRLRRTGRKSQRGSEGLSRHRAAQRLNSFRQWSATFSKRPEPRPANWRFNRAVFR